MSAERMIQVAIARADLWICALSRGLRLAACVLIGAVAGQFIQKRRWRK